MPHIKTGRLLFGLTITAAVLILQGFSYFAAAVLFYASGAALIRKQESVIFAAVFLGGLSLIYRGSTGYALLCSGAVLGVVFSDSPISRYSFFLSSAAVLLSRFAEGLLPLIASVLAASLLKVKFRRCIIVASGISLMVVLSGLPLAHAPSPITSQEVLTGNGVMWGEPAELHLGCPELLLRNRERSVSGLTIRASAGGVRDTSFIGFAISGDRIFPVYPGENTIRIEEPEFPVLIRMSRDWKPFTHPVIHFVSAGASI